MHQKISPELIPHSLFHTGIWLLSPSRPHWYYFMTKTRQNEISNKHFLKSVDKPLRQLVKFLHSKGINTTPSCAGHHKDEKDFEKIYAALKNDKTHIRNGGLTLKDIETGESYLFQNKNYALPWDKKTFLRNVLSYQQNGIVGIIPGRKLKVKQKILNLRIDGADIHEKDSIIFVSTKKEDAHVWKIVTQEIKKCFKE